jgi:hypothetical protein
MTNDTGLPPGLVDLIYNATLAAYWRKKALSHFLRRCGVSEKTLAQWDETLTKREWLDQLFPRLEEKDAGRTILRRMAESLAAMTAFPDLEGWEDAKLKQDNAKRAVEALKKVLQAEVDEVAREKAREDARAQARKLQEVAARSRASLEKLSVRLTELCGQVGTQQAGYAFQDWFYDLLDYFEIQNRRPYTHGGRQHDGSLTLEGTTYIVELKFTGDQVGAGEVDSLLVKVNDKADNTMGIFLSMAGFSTIAIQQASGRKTPLLLLDSTHVFSVLGGAKNLRDLILRCRRHASQTGEAYLPGNNIP